LSAPTIRAENVAVITHRAEAALFLIGKARIIAAKLPDVPDRHFAGYLRDIELCLQEAEAALAFAQEN
jgi:hypothetical protein